MANRKIDVYKPNSMTEGKQALIQGMLESEMNNHLGYDKYECSSEPNYPNGSKSKTVLWRILSGCATGQKQLV